MTVLCQMMGLSRQAVYSQHHAQIQETFCEEVVIELVNEKRSRMPRIGSVKLYLLLKDDLQKLPNTLGRDKFHNLLKKHGLLVPTSKRTCHTTQSFHRFHTYTNLVKGVAITRIHQVVVADITYLRLEGKFCYLCLLTDVYSRKIVGYDLSESLSVEGALRAARMAYRGLSEMKEMIHHSDRGIQYCCDAYVKLMSKYHVRLSMGETGNPYDNAIAERINGILKTEFYLHVTFPTLEIARQAVREAIETYNTLRPHMSIGYLTPAMKYAA